MIMSVRGSNRLTSFSLAGTVSPSNTRRSVCESHASPQTTAGYAWMAPQPAALAVEAIANKLEEMMTAVP